MIKKSRKIFLVVKKITDLITASIISAILSPLFLVVALLIKINSRGPVFFRQIRIGKNEKPFKIWKFRTMIENAENIGLGMVSIENDSRITKVGKFLREWTLDEWPQLINVLKGEMSLVGPRPLPNYAEEELSDIRKKRLTVLPGMVSLVDIRGRNLVPWEERFKIDNWYIDNWSLRLDLKIILLTPLVIFSRKGVYGEGEKNIPPEIK